mmetsp:Transcript_3723/g.10215  ORF Transcript_3723/g.10215 Transcript_3723/m.10215 type:complete len:245 (+) Transcript_3723:795-1529(+)
MPQGPEAPEPAAEGQGRRAGQRHPEGDRLRHGVQDCGGQSDVIQGGHPVLPRARGARGKVRREVRPVELWRPHVLPAVRAQALRRQDQGGAVREDPEGRGQPGRPGVVLRLQRRQGARPGAAAARPPGAAHGRGVAEPRLGEEPGPRSAEGSPSEVHRREPLQLPGDEQTKEVRDARDRRRHGRPPDQRPPCDLFGAGYEPGWHPHPRGAARGLRQGGDAAARARPPAADGGDRREPQRRYRLR